MKSYFQVFSVWDKHNTCMSWNNTIAMTDEWGFARVPMVYEGIYDETVIRELGERLLLDGYEGDVVEGYVIRLHEAFHYNYFSESVAKVVRQGHVGKDEIHWMSQWNESMVNKLG